MMGPEARDKGNAPHKIVSLQNERVKAIRALEMRKTRRQTGRFVAEGVSVLMTARDAGHVPLSLVYNRDRSGSAVCRELIDWALGTGCEVLEVSDSVLGKLSTKDNPQAMLGVFTQRYAALPVPEDCNDETVWIALEDIRDPGNLGTIIRTVDAVGAAGVVLLGTCCDPYSREAVRATMGSVFNVAIALADFETFEGVLESWPGDVVGLHLEAGDDFRAVSYKMPSLVVMGSEGPGLSEKLTARCSRLVKIPMCGSLDSLNLSVASALMLYQIRGSFLSL